MTEEDTFRVLRRVPFNEMRALVQVFNQQWRPQPSSYSHKDYISDLNRDKNLLFAQKGWDRNEYYDILARLFEKND